MVRAVSLFSGSTASCLATEIVANEPGVDEIILLTFRSPFFDRYEEVKELADELWPELKFRSKSIKKETGEIGRTIRESNGGLKVETFCTRCRVSLLESGRNFLTQAEADFLVTGEIPGRRGLDVDSFKVIDAEAGVSGLVFRPLSAQKLPSTIPESNGWVRESLSVDERDGGTEELLQSLVSDYGMGGSRHYSASDRCKLTEPEYRERLRDLVEESRFNANDLKLLDFTKYYKIDSDTRVVLGVDGQEKYSLHDYFLPKDLRMYLPCNKGPMALVRSEWQSKTQERIDQIVETAAKIIAANGEVGIREMVPVNYRFEHEDGTSRTTVRPLERGELEGFQV